MGKSRAEEALPRRRVDVWTTSAREDRSPSHAAVAAVRAMSDLHATQITPTPNGFARSLSDLTCRLEVTPATTAGHDAERDTNRP